MLEDNPGRRHRSDSSQTPRAEGCDHLLGHRRSIADIVYSRTGWRAVDLKNKLGTSEFELTAYIADGRAAGRSARKQ